MSQADAPVLVVICGLSFAGKTTLGGAVARRFNHKQVDVDATKVRLYGVRFDDNALDQDAWNRIYEETDLEIARYLRSRASVIDASRNFRKAERSHARHIAALNGGKFLLIYMDTPEDVARKRLLANRQHPERADWGDTSFDEIVRVMEPPSADEHALLCHYEVDIERWISEHSAVLTGGR
jgi:predicted kinase